MEEIKNSGQLPQEEKDKIGTEESPYAGYKPQKGVTPPWNPFDPARRQNRVTIKERKFLMVLSMTGKLVDAYRAAYKVKDYPDKQLERARVNAMAQQVLARLKKKAPELVAAFTFDDITPDFVKKEMLKLYNKEDVKDADKIRLLELMGKTQAMFTDKNIVETKIQEVVDQIYKEGDEDFPMRDDRLTRADIEEGILSKYPKA